MGTAQVFVPQQGTVTAIHVGEGQTVARDDVLLTIDTARLTGDGTDVNEVTLKGLSTQKLLLTNQIDAEERSTRTEKARLSAAISSGEAELTQLSSQIRLQEEQIQLAQDLVNSAAKMRAAGYLSAPELYKRQESLLESKQALSSLKQRYAARQTELRQTRSSLEQLPTEFARRIQPLRSELEEIGQRMTEAAGRSSYAIRAPVAGRIANIQATVGQVADPKRLQLNIMPLESPLQAVLYVPTRAVGFVRVGQKVRLLYEAFPYERFGTYSGRVVSVSKTILTEADVSAPLQIQEPSYKVIVALDRPDIDANGQRIPLQTGMLLRADILLEKRKLVALILDPILKIRM